MPPLIGSDRKIIISLCFLFILSLLDCIFHNEVLCFIDLPLKNMNHFFFFNVVLSLYFLISCLVHTDENIMKGLPTSCMSAPLVLHSEMYTVHNKDNTKLVKLVIA